MFNQICTAIIIIVQLVLRLVIIYCFMNPLQPFNNLKIPQETLFVILITEFRSNLFSIQTLPVYPKG